MSNANCVAKVCECAGLESPLTQTLSPLIKGGEGREWGDPACENPLPRAPNECG
jgi:hypothetical protein